MNTQYKNVKPYLYLSLIASELDRVEAGHFLAVGSVDVPAVETFDVCQITVTTFDTNVA